MYVCVLSASLEGCGFDLLPHGKSCGVQRCVELGGSFTIFTF